MNTTRESFRPLSPDELALKRQEREDLALRGPILLEIASKHLSGTALVTEEP